MKGTILTFLRAKPVRQGKSLGARFTTVLSAQKYDIDLNKLYPVLILKEDPRSVIIEIETVLKQLESISGKVLNSELPDNTKVEILNTLYNLKKVLTRVIEVFKPEFIPSKSQKIAGNS